MSCSYSPTDGMFRYDLGDVIALLKELGRGATAGSAMRQPARKTKKEKTVTKNWRWFDVFRTYALLTEVKGELMVQAKPWYRGQDRADRGDRWRNKRKGWAHG